MIKLVYESDGNTDKQQLAELTALARKTGMPITILIGKTISMTIDPAAKDEEIEKIFKTESLAYIKRCRKWFDRRYIMTPRK